MSTPKFAFTKLVVKDIAAAERFYCGVFGMKVLSRVGTHDHKYALEETILSPAGAADAHRLIVTRYLERPCPPAGSAWTGFVVADIEAALAAVVCAGGKIEVPVHRNSEHGVLAAIAADPDGHLIEIVQML